MSMQATRMQVTTLTTPVGPFRVVSDGRCVAAAGFTAEPDDLRQLLPPALRGAVLDPTANGPVEEALAAYFAGDLGAIVDLPVNGSGTEYQRRTWRVLRAVPPGAPVSYTELAARTGSPAAARAAGSACGRNPTAVVVPCHRVVRGDGTLGGYAWGLDVKRWLLDHERRHMAPTPASRPPRPPARARTPPAGRRS